MSRQLTLNYKRVLYLLEDSEHSRRAMGQYVDVRETDDGVVTISHDGRSLPARSFHKDGHVRQAAIVDNKLLQGALQYAKKFQEERDAKRVTTRGVTKRDKRLLRARQTEAAQV